MPQPSSSDANDVATPSTEYEASHIPPVIQPRTLAMPQPPSSNVNDGASPSTEYALVKLSHEIASLKAMLQHQHDAIMHRLYGGGDGDGAVKVQASSPSVVPEVICESEKSACKLDRGGDQSPDHKKAQATWKEYRQNTVSDLQLADNVCESPHSGSRRLRHMISSPKFDLMTGAIILINICFTSVGLEWRGQHYGCILGLKSGGEGWPRVESFFMTSEHVFNVFYAVELGLRIWAFGKVFLKKSFHLFDASIVTLGCIDSFLLQPLQTAFTVDISTLRILRLLRCFRIAKIMRLGEHVSEMRVLVLTLFACIRGVIWGMVLLAIIILGGAIFAMQLSMAVFDDESVELQHRQWLYERFGTTTRSVYTMFECTFSPGWQNYTWRSFEHISSSFVFFWIPYIVFVNFAVMRVLGAVFLKQTLDVAGLDAERIAMEKMKAKEYYASILRKLFKEADTSGDGCISKDEFENMLLNQHVMELFEELDLEFDEIVALFGVMTADDGHADYEELLEGALKMKNSARTIDTIHLLHSQMEITRELKKISVHFDEFRGSHRG